MSHANAALTPRARLQVARLVVDQHVPIAEVAARLQCSWPTVKRWADRYATDQPMTDRSSRPHRMPAKTDPATTRRIVALRLRKRLGPVQLAALTGVAPSTAHRVLTRCRLGRLSHVDR
ncbi:helix-turn-helix domain-containing protein, partial [Puerhibacterium sp. TATVAM-FAB25]|uniref:helix-turn-helix domain-containing protein n=1 Tax=Puerhibacterium sp. TATVAM-FAB25 TaxID=3093699 RepID=UPI00397CB60B